MLQPKRWPARGQRFGLQFLRRLFYSGHMRAWLSLVATVALANAAFSEGISQVELGETTYSNISKVYIGAGNRVTILFPGGGTSGTADKFPPDFLASWGIKGSVLREFLSQPPSVTPSAVPGAVAAAIPNAQSAVAIVLVY